MWALDSGGLQISFVGAVVKLLPCDHEVTGSSPGNSLLQKCRERLRTKDPSGRTLPLTLRKQELRALGLPFVLILTQDIL